jgi:hypothetical protein
MNRTLKIGEDIIPLSAEPCELTNIGLKYHCDKAWHHKFTHVYSKLFEYLGYTRESKFKFLEIGFSHGCSHLMWREYFPNATIVAIDIEDWKWYQNPNNLPGMLPSDRIKLKEAINTNFDDLVDDNFQFYIGDQKDINVLKSVCDKFGEFDIILDDASHRDLETKSSFDYLFPYLRSGSPYIIEDLHGQLNTKVRYDIEMYNKKESFQYLDHSSDIKTVEFIMMTHNVASGGGSSNMGIIIKKQ